MSMKIKLTRLTPISFTANVKEENTERVTDALKVLANNLTPDDLEQLAKVSQHILYKEIALAKLRELKL